MTSQHTPIRRSQAIAVLCLAIVLLLSVSAGAGGYLYPATGYFLDGISADSSWNEIMAKPGIRAVFPYIAFGSTYVPLSDVCVDGDTVAIANPRIDNGIRIPADELRAQVRAATAGQGSAASTGGPIAAAVPVQPTADVALRDPVLVYKVLDKGQWPDWIYLFEKPWPIPTCPAK
jgi:hypothetical protein